jgi:hypothetical protein
MSQDIVQEELAHLVRVGWIVLIPSGVLFSMVLYKLVMLLHGLLSFLTLAQYELAPAMKDLKRTAEHVEALTHKAVTGVKTVENGVVATGSTLNSASKMASQRISALWSKVKTRFL